MLAQREAPECKADRPASATLRSSCAGPAGEVLWLRRTIGNAAVARIRGDIAYCAESEARLRAIADSGNDAASVEVLSAFTPEGINSVELCD